MTSRLRTLAALLFTCRISVVHSILVAGVVMPHGDFAFDPALLKPGTSERNVAEEVAAAAKWAGDWLGNVVDPDIILLSTPHGQELSRDFALYLNSYGSGYASIGADLHNNTERKVSLPRVHLEPKFTKELVSVMEKTSDVTGILNFADSEDTQLRWGEVIPLLLIPQRNNKTNLSPRHHMIWSHPLRRYTQSTGMIPELLDIGRRVSHWAASKTERIALVISSDLSHTHLPDGPYGYSNASSLFDDAVGKWARDPVHAADALLETARSFQDKALSCGFTGLVMLHGALYGTNSTSSSFQSRLLANRNATYYGMMVATFSPRSLPDFVEPS